MGESGRMAIFSDIHSNLEALTAVLADMQAQGISRLLCLGDIVGYAADPGLCVDAIMGLGCPCVLGNHDAACLDSSFDGLMNEYAEAGLDYARAQLNPGQLKFLGGLPMKIEGDQFTAVHASLIPGDPWEYMIDAHDVAGHFRHQKKPVSFCGHTHYPDVWMEGPHGPQTLNTTLGVNLQAGRRYLINVGSVGQPRDRRPESCYAVMDWDANTVELRRIAYDIRATQKKIRQARLPRYTGQRLKLGR